MAARGVLSSTTQDPATTTAQRPDAATTADDSLHLKSPAAQLRRRAGLKYCLGLFRSTAHAAIGHPTISDPSKSSEDHVDHPTDDDG